MFFIASKMKSKLHRLLHVFDYDMANLQIPLQISLPIPIIDSVSSPMVCMCIPPAHVFWPYFFSLGLLRLKIMLNMSQIYAHVKLFMAKKVQA